MYVQMKKYYLYVQSDLLWLADVFDNFRNICLGIYDVVLLFTLYMIFTAPELAWQESLENKKVKLELVINIDMLLLVEKGIIRGTYHVVH